MFEVTQWKDLVLFGTGGDEIHTTYVNKIYYVLSMIGLFIVLYKEGFEVVRGKDAVPLGTGGDEIHPI